jgi:Rieske Fe-S protein
MDRKEFLKICGGTCLGLIGLSLLEGCSSTKHVQGITTGNKVQIPKNEFEIIKKDKTFYIKNIVCNPEDSHYPIAVYRFSETDYRAFLLRCTHQGNELNLNGDILTCSAHGSEFNNHGEVIQGPAEKKLQAFKVTSDEKNIYIHLN